MNRRDFLRQGFAKIADAASSSKLMRPLAVAAELSGPSRPSGIPQRRLGKTGVDLSILGFGGILVKGAEQSIANNLVAEAFDRGINYYDVAPQYGDAQEKLGPALQPYRARAFLACKTLERTKAGAARDLENSLRLLQTDHIDLYQFHALTTLAELEEVFGPNGAMETFQAARQAGKIRFIGFSAHSVETALAALDRYDFDSLMFPINFALFTQSDFGPQVLQKAMEKGLGIIALKAMAYGPKSDAQRVANEHPKCWYAPAEPYEAALALRWSLSHPITAAIPPGEEDYFQLAMTVARDFVPLQADEEKALLERAVGVESIFPNGGP